ncbi:quercetin 2,3-dioxygenase ['Osedax' symbiont bacterium Rs2_46_30_T18]|nr:quercetin 2,3-dioxygenase ['Osedax' symbiont bacterium Rs2_46_30_T18]
MSRTSVINEHSNVKELIAVTSGVPASDGAGVKLTRIIGGGEVDMLDPFLMLDCFESDNPDDYLAGFPTHPHRGFETVTYLLNGRMRHKDNRGNEGVIAPGGVQWMTAGKGIMHSEMPEQQDGLLKGFQLWVNLPASAKMTEPAYQEFPAEQVALEQRDDGTVIRVISGVTDRGTSGPVENQYTEPTYLDVSLKAGAVFSQSIPAGHNSFVYVIEGQLQIAGRSLSAKKLGVFGAGDEIELHSDVETRLLLVAAKPLNEPVARHGPFVMNTHAQIIQAVEDYHSGKF